LEEAVSKASDTIREYLELGGLLNPEMMNQSQHEAVRKTLIDAREDIERLERELRRSMSRVMKMEVAGDNLAVCATCRVSDPSQFVTAWRKAKK
jgi:methyl coenzyme M reductase subunit C-like uncharacterized protein (methanogenesis marker protein 7)